MKTPHVCKTPSTKLRTEQVLGVPRGGEGTRKGCPYGACLAIVGRGFHIIHFSMPYSAAVSMDWPPVDWAPARGAPTDWAPVGWAPARGATTVPWVLLSLL